VLIHRGGESPGEVETKQRVKHRANTAEPGANGVAQSNTTVVVGQLKCEPDRQTNPLPEPPNDFLAQYCLHHDTSHSHAPLADVLIHEDDVTDMIVASGEGVELQVRSRPSTSIALVGTVEQEVRDLTAGDPVNEDGRLDRQHHGHPEFDLALTPRSSSFQWAKLPAEAVQTSAPVRIG
jgi:hypothetical protein